MRQAWSEEEWALVINYYKQQNPQFNWETVADPLALPVSFRSLKDSQAAVLPPERHIRTEDRKAFCRRMFKHLMNQQKPAGAIAPPFTPKDSPTAEKAQPAAPKQAKPRKLRVDYMPQDWRALAEHLTRAYPARDFIAAPVTKSILLDAITATFPPERRATHPVILVARRCLAKAFAALAAPGAAQFVSSDFIASHSNIITNQLDGEDDGPPKGRVVWKPDELRKIAIELVCANPALLDSTNNLRPIHVRQAQKVLPTSRRRIHSAITTANVRGMFTPILRTLRNEVNKERRALAEQEAMAKAQEAIAQREQEAAEQAAREKEAAQNIMRGMLDSPEVQNRILQKASIGQHIDHMIEKFMEMQADKLLRVLSSDTLKGAFTINIHLPGSGPQPEQKPAQPQPDISCNGVHVEVKRTPTVAIVGALAQQGDAIKSSFPQLQFKLVDKNLTSTMLKDAVARCDKVFCMTDFVSHSVDGICAKAAGENYQRVHGGVSSVRSAINAWLCTSQHH